MARFKDPIPFNLIQPDLTQSNLSAIRKEIQEIQDGNADPVDNVIKRAPHTMEAITADTWDRPYSRQQAAFPLVKISKYYYYLPC